MLCSKSGCREVLKRCWATLYACVLTVEANIGHSSTDLTSTTTTDSCILLLVSALIAGSCSLVSTFWTSSLQHARAASEHSSDLSVNDNTRFHDVVHAGLALPPAPSFFRAPFGRGSPVESLPEELSSERRSLLCRLIVRAILHRRQETLQPATAVHADRGRLSHLGSASLSSGRLRKGCHVLDQREIRRSFVCSNGSGCVPYLSRSLPGS